MEYYFNFTIDHEVEAEIKGRELPYDIADDDLSDNYLSRKIPKKLTSLINL